MGDSWLWQGRRVVLADGTTVTLPDTEINQDDYPQPASQREGLGFPKMRLVALMCLASGALLDAAEGPCKGKGSDEQTLFRGLLGNLEAGDGCDSGCQLEEGCGDGVLDQSAPDSPEECDDDNVIDGDGCSASCTVELGGCGDGVVQAGEQCDDDNVVNGDGCNSTCHNELE